MIFTDAGFTQFPDECEGIITQTAWSDLLNIAVPARHPLLAHKRIPIEELVHYPLALCHPENCEEYHPPNRPHVPHRERLARRHRVCLEL